MNSSATIRLHTGNAIPPEHENTTKDTIALWQEMGDCFTQRHFASRHNIDISSEARVYQLTLRACPLLQSLKDTKAQSEPFALHNKAYIVTLEQCGYFH